MNWTKEMIEMLKQLVNEHSNLELSKKFNVSLSSLEGTLTRYRIRRSKERKSLVSSNNRKTEVKWKQQQIVEHLSPCWVCTSHKPTFDGYIHIERQGKVILLHRYMYEQYNGNIPNNLIVRHVCDVRNCINPDHLLLGTVYDNAQDMVNRNRQTKGENHPKALLTENQVIKIKKALSKGLSVSELAEKYKVKKDTIYSIKSGKNWKHINIK